MNFPRRDDATNKELILTIIEIQGYLSRYGESHTNWHETLNEVIERLEQAESESQESKEVPQKMRGKWIEREDYYEDTYYDCSVCGESWTTIEGTPWDNGMNFCPHCGSDMRGTE